MDSRYLNLFFFFCLALLAEIVGTIGGFGSSVFFVSASQFFVDFNTVLGLTGLLHIFSNLFKIFLFRKTINWSITLWLGSSSLILAIIGAWLTSVVDFAYAKIILSLFLITISSLFLMKSKIKITPSKSNTFLSGGIAGFLAGYIGTGGAVRGLVLASFNLEKNFFVGTSAVIDFGVDLSRTIIYLEYKYLDASHAVYVPGLVLAAFLGSYLGKKALVKINQDLFQRIVLVLIFITGILMLINELQPVLK